MKKNVSLVLAAGLACGIVGFAQADETVSFTGVNSNDLQGNGANEHRTATLANAGPVGRIVISGQLTEVQTATYASEARLRLTPPDGSAAFTIQPFTTTGFTGSITVTNYTFTLGTPVSNGQGNWDVEFFDSYNDGAGADSVWDNISLTFVVPPQPPANDDCSNAIAIGLGTFNGDTSAATTSVLSACGGSDNGKDVWYAFTAPSAGDFNFATCGSGFDTVLTAYDVCGGSELACNDDADCADTLRSKISVTGLSEGQTILIRVAGYGYVGGTGAANGLFTLTASLPPVPPSNDECAGAIAISGDTAFDTTLATDSGVALASCGLPTTIHNDIWYTYTASTAGTLTLSTCGATIDTVVSLFDACGGSQVACNDDSDVGSGSPCEGTTRSYLTYAMTAGQTVYISLGAYLTNTYGTGTLAASFEGVGCPADFNGDNFVDGFDYDDFVACFEGDACPPGKTADFNGDGFPDGFDYDDFVLAFETGCL